MDKCARCQQAPPRPRTGSRGPKPIYCEACSIQNKRDHMQGWHERGKRERRVVQCVICDVTVPEERGAQAVTCSPECQEKRRVQYHATWYQANRDRVTASDRERRYGITADEFADRLAEQNHECLICRTTAPPLVVDHNHETGAIRGLLCANCNVALGMLADNPLLCERAAAYLRKAA